MAASSQPTPRTDEAEKNSDMKDRVPAWFARQLERELNAWKIGAHAEQDRALRCEEAKIGAPRSETAEPDLLAQLRKECSIDEYGDPVGAQPERGWETGYAAGIRTIYRILKKTTTGDVLVATQSKPDNNEQQANPGVAHPSAPSLMRDVMVERDALKELLWTLYEGIYGHRSAEGIDPYKTAVGGAMALAKAWRERGEPAERAVGERDVQIANLVAAIGAMNQAAPSHSPRVAAIRDEVKLFVNDDGKYCATINRADYEWLLSTASASSARATPQWIPRSERMPDAGMHVLLTNGEWISTGYFAGRHFSIDVQHESDPGLTPTHWMPLPEAPSV